MEECLKIGICDDEKEVHVKMKHYMEIYAKDRGISYILVHFLSGLDLLLKEDAADLDILFLDIEMPGQDGIETAFQLQKREISYKIIMLTGKTERFKEAFKIGAFRFVTKPIQEQELFEAMDDARNRMMGRQEVPVFYNGKNHTILQKEICYIQTDKTSTMIYTKKYEYHSELSLKQWEAVLDKRMFFRCHKAYIVNFEMIAEIEKDTVFLRTGEKILVSRRKKNEFERKYMEFDTKYC